MKKITLMILAFLSTLIGFAQTETLTGWSFPTDDGTPLVIEAECGSGNLYADGTNGSSDWTGGVDFFGGHTPAEANQVCGSTANTQAYSLLNGASGANNGKHLVFKFSTADYEDIVLTYSTRGTANGFDTHTWAYSTDGVAFTDVSTVTGTNNTTFFTQTVDFSSNTAINNQSDVYIRLTLSGAGTQNSQNNRLDNIKFLGTEVQTIPSGYCIPTANSNVGTHGIITNFTFNDINNPTTDNDDAYQDYTNMSTTVVQGESYNLSITTEAGGMMFETLSKVWIDWNKDNIFDEDEAYDLGSATQLTYGVPVNSPMAIQIPADALGEYRLRVRTYSKNSMLGGGSVAPCDNLNNSEAEDYTIIVEEESGSTPSVGCEIAVTISWEDYADVTNWRLLDGNGNVAIQGGVDWDDEFYYYNSSSTKTHIVANPPYSLEITIDDWLEYCDNNIDYSVTVGGVQDISGTVYVVCEDIVTETFVIGDCPDCSSPTGLEVTATSDSATLSWTGTGNSFDIVWGTAGFNPETGGTLVTNVTSPYTLTDLPFGSSYSFYVRQDCGAGDTSSWTGPYSFVVGAYTGGDIPTQSGTAASITVNSTDFCTPEPTITIEVPTGYQISGLQVMYSMTAHNGAWMSEQRSFIYSPTLNIGETTMTSGTGLNQGTFSYNRSMDFANGATGTVDFVLRAWRTWSDIDEGCNTDYNYVNNATWVIIPAFEEIVTDPCTGGMVVPVFAPVSPICQGGFLLALPTTSTNGITGTWSPALNNMETTTYEFTPDTGQCAETTTMTISVNPTTIPTFSQVAPICAGDDLEPLPMVSNQGITGTWSPALDNTQTTTYIFTPSAGQCAATVFITITVNEVPDSPTADSPQTMNAGQTLADIIVDGENLVWYSDPMMTTVVEESFEFTEGSYTFWVTQTVGDCTSEPTEIQVEVTLSTNGFDNASFRTYPNPVKDFFNVSYSKEITSISVVNILGQTVIEKTVNATDTQIDMTTLPTGSYFVKVTVQGNSKTVKVMKQ